MKNKKNVFVFAIICITFFIIFNYIFCVSGNNIIRNQNEFVEDIFKKLENYEANIEVIVISNKNENKYNIYQVVDNEYSKLIVNSPENIRGLEIEIKDENFKITNGNQEMTKIYENYKPIINNSLFINSFIDDYKNNETEILEENEDIIIKIEDENIDTIIR